MKNTTYSRELVNLLIRFAEQHQLPMEVVSDFANELLALQMAFNELEPKQEKRYG